MAVSSGRHCSVPGVCRFSIGRHSSTRLARQMVMRLLDGRIAWTPLREEGRYEFTGRAKFEKLLTGLVDLREVVRPQRDSNPCFGLERATS